MNRPANPITRRRCLAMMAGMATAPAAAHLYAGGRGRGAALRLAISVETIIGANISDARTAYRLWIQQASRDNAQAAVEVEPEIFVSSEQILRGVRQGTIDCFGVNALEFAHLADLADPEHLVLLSYLAEGIDYVLLVHNNSRFNKLEDLRGANIASHLNHDMVLLPAWLNTLLAENDLPAPATFFASLTQHEKLNQVVLPVFFHGMDGACVARRNWQTLVELNPQIGRDLRALAVSPRVIPCGIGIRRGSDPDAVKAFIDALQALARQVEGQQILALYQANGFLVRPTSVINDTLALVRQSERLSAGARKGKP